jgi:hypothetical protein
MEVSGQFHVPASLTPVPTARRLGGLHDYRLSASTSLYFVVTTGRADSTSLYSY